MSSTQRRWTALWDVLPVVFAIPVIAGLAITFASLFGFAHPDLGWATTVAADGQAVYLGTPLHQDPAVGYTGQLYTPLFPMIVGGLLHIVFWTGIPLVLIGLSGMALLGLASWLAVRPGRRWSALGALGLGSLAWWGVSGLGTDLLFEARADHFAWLLGLGGIVATAFAGQRPTWRRIALAVALLTAAFWTKQTTVVASAVAVGWFVLLALAGAVPFRRAIAFGGVLLLANVAVLGAFNLATDGWEWRLNFLYPTRHAQSPELKRWVLEGLRGGAFAYLFLAAMAVIALARWPRLPRRPYPSIGDARQKFASWYQAAPRAQTVTLPLALFVAIGFVAAVYFRRKQGGADNQFIGATWAAGLLAAAFWGQIGSSARRSAAAALVIVGGFAIALSGVASARLERHQIVQPPLRSDIHFQETPARLRALAARGLTYDSSYGDLNVRTRGEVFTNYYNFVDLLAARSQPLALVRDFENRRFAYTSLFPEDPGSDQYTSALGKWEEGWIWKINRVIEARYAPIPGMPGEYQRRPGPERAVWQRACFGPFQLAGVTWEIGKGGGFWCSPSPGIITQRGTPAPVTQLRTTAPVASVAGGMRVTMAIGQELFLGTVGDTPHDALLVHRIDRDHYSIAVMHGGKPLSQVRIPASDDGAAALTVRAGEPALSAGRAPVATLHLGGGVLQLLAQANAAPRVDLRQLHVTPTP